MRRSDPAKRTRAPQPLPFDGKGGVRIQIMRPARREESGLTHDLRVFFGVGAPIHRLQLVL